jgi:hypothetical protein
VLLAVSWDSSIKEFTTLENQGKRSGEKREPRINSRIAVQANRLIVRMREKEDYEIHLGFEKTIVDVRIR